MKGRGGRALREAASSVFICLEGFGLRREIGYRSPKGNNQEEEMRRIEIPHQITYNTKTHVEVSVVAKSLLANEALVRESLAVLGDMFPDAVLSIADIRVSALSNNSPLREVLGIGVFVAFQDGLEREVPKLIESLMGIEVPEEYTTIITVLVLIVAICIIDQCVQRLFPGREVKKLKREYESKLEQLSELSGVEACQIDGLVRDRIASRIKSKLVEFAFNFFMPAKQDGAVAIEGVAGQLVSADAVREVPSEVDLAALDSRTTFPLNDVTVEIHRSDRSSNTDGWRGILEQVSPKMLKVELSPEISPEEVYGRRSIRGDVVIVSEKDASGEWFPKVIHIMKVID